MPKMYEHIKASYLHSGKSEDEAQRLAAMTYIAKGKSGDRSSRAKSLHRELLSQFSGRKKTHSRLGSLR
jgi:hypothetical protein